MKRESLDSYRFLQGDACEPHPARQRRWSDIVPVPRATPSTASANPPTDLSWEAIRHDAALLVKSEPLLTAFVHDQILQHSHFEAAVSHIVGGKLEDRSLQGHDLCGLLRQAMDSDARIGRAIRADIQAVQDRDPACSGPAEPLLYYKGVHALAAYRAAHWLWNGGRHKLARCLQSRLAEQLSVDIHPAARIGQGILLDHAHGVVIGETAVVEDNVSILHNVTLGGTGKETGDRHPKVRSGVLIGAGALILGNIEIGCGAKVGAGSVVVSTVQPHVTVAGQLATVVGIPATAKPSLDMNHHVCAGHGNGVGSPAASSAAGCVGRCRDAPAPRTAGLPK